MFIINEKVELVDKILHYFNYVVGVVGGFLCYILGGYDQVLEILIGMVVTDYITGLLSGYVMQELDSDTGRKGIAKKVGLFVVVAIAHMVDSIMGTGGAIRTMAIWFYISKEGISALENLSQSGVPIPEKLERALKQLNDKSDSKTP